MWPFPAVFNSCTDHSSRLEQQAEELIHKDTDLLTVVCGFDLSEVAIYEIGGNAWSARYSYEPMVRAFYCKKLADFTNTELHEYLADAERARTLGFNPDLNQFTQKFVESLQAEEDVNTVI